MPPYNDTKEAETKTCGVSCQRRSHSFGYHTRDQSYNMQCIPEAELRTEYSTALLRHTDSLSASS